MTPRAAPLWQAMPGRFARLSRGRARIAIGVVVALLIVSLSALAIPDPTPVTAASRANQQETDLVLYEKIVSTLRQGGEDYYHVAADALRGGDYPLRPFVVFRLPALAVIEAALPPMVLVGLLYALAGLTAAAWAVRIGPVLPALAPRVALLVLMAGSMLAFLQPGLIAFHEIWAGLLVALSLALWRPDRWVESAAIALAAMLIRETAVLYALAMAVFAWREGNRRERIGWSVAIGLFVAMLGVHAWGVSGVTGPTDPASPGWLGLWGPGLFVKGVTLATGLQMLPLWAAAPLVALALVGWASWNDPLAARMVAVVLAYAVAIALFARLDTFYWALMVAPLFLVGLVFVPDGLRDLARQALDRRRVRVQRISR